MVNITTLVLLAASVATGHTPTPILQDLNITTSQIKHERLIGIAQPLLSTTEDQSDNVSET